MHEADRRGECLRKVPTPLPTIPAQRKTSLGMLGARGRKRLLQCFSFQPHPNNTGAKPEPPRLISCQTAKAGGKQCLISFCSHLDPRTSPCSTPASVARMKSNHSAGPSWHGMREIPACCVKRTSCISDCHARAFAVPGHSPGFKESRLSPEIVIRREKKL